MKTYQEIRNKHLNDLGKPSSGGFFIFALVLIFAVFIIILSLVNTASMQSVSVDNAKQYVSELTLQTAGTLSTDVADKKTVLSNIAESLRLHFDDGLEETSTDDYLNTHLQTLFDQSEYDFLIFQHVDAQIITLGTAPENLSAVLENTQVAVQEAEEKNSCIAYIYETNVYYVTPVYSGGAIIGSLIAGASTNTLNTLMRSHVYQNQSSFCLTNREGKLLIASGDSRFDELSVQLDPASSEETAFIQNLETDFLAGSSGVVEVKLSGNSNYLMTYAPIEGEDWMIVTLVPTNIFSKAYTSYMKRALAFTIGAAIMFVVLLGLLVYSYRGARKKLEYLAYTDSLTLGINSVDFQMQYALLQRKANPLEYSIVFLDINDFKLINELGGFDAGDRLIKYVYESIGKLLNKKAYETACRVEVDHYLICLHENTAAGIQKRIDQIAKVVNDASDEVTLGLRITFGLGACIVDNAELGIEELTQRARIAKRSSTRHTHNQCILYTEAMRHEISQKAQLDYMAEKALENNEFKVYYQPKVDMYTGNVVGAEALVRWLHPHRGLISPADFVPILEESGRILEVDHYVYRDVCRYLAARKERGEALFPVSVNLSRAHFWKDDVVAEFAAVADEYGIEHSLLEFEITETLFMEQDRLEKIKEGIKQMHAQGFSCAMDDFGVGYSSLSLVNEMDIDTLKFDRSFFMHLDDAKSREVATCLIEMGDRLNLKMVAEGIETQEQFDFLASTRASVIQGYYYSKPIPEDEFEAWEKACA